MTAKTPEELRERMVGDAMDALSKLPWLIMKTNIHARLDIVNSVLDAQAKAADSAGWQLVRVTRRERPPFVIQDDEQICLRTAAEIEADRLEAKAAGPPKSLIDKARAQAIEECAKVAEAFPRQILQFYDRPGGPPGNAHRLSNGHDIAEAIRVLSAAPKATP